MSGRGSSGRRSANSGSSRSRSSRPVTTASRGSGARPWAVRISRASAGSPGWPVALGPHGAGRHQNPVGGGSDGSKHQPVGWSTEPSGHAVELDGSVDRRDHVHHEPRAVVRRRTFRHRVDVERIDRLFRRRQQLAHDRTVAAAGARRRFDLDPASSSARPRLGSPRSVGDRSMESGNPPTYRGSVDGTGPFQHKSTIRPLLVHMTTVVTFLSPCWMGRWNGGCATRLFSSRSRCPWGSRSSGVQKWLPDESSPLTYRSVQHGTIARPIDLRHHWWSRSRRRSHLPPTVTSM